MEYKPIIAAAGDKVNSHPDPADIYAGRRAEKGGNKMDPTTEKKRTRKKSKAGWLVLLAVLLLLGVGAWWFNGTYFIAGGRPYRRDAQALDLRGQSVSVETYGKIAETLPGAEILWDVPLSAGAADCTAEIQKWSAKSLR